MKPSSDRAAALNLRLASALVLAPVAVLLVVGGGWAFTALLVAAGAILSHEWDRLTGGSGRDASAVTLAVGLGAAAMLAAAGAWAFAAAAIILTGLLAALVGHRQRRNALWAALAALWFGLPILSLSWLRAQPESGLWATLWLFALVWACDSGAYMAGRGIGGPRLAPRISPNKTWAGLAGGLAAAAAVGAVAAAWSGVATVWALAVASAAVALVSQLGDLAESAVKRRFGVKDSGRLIPGHGGLFDRVDGLLFAAPAAALMVLLQVGMAQPWR